MLTTSLNFIILCRFGQIRIRRRSNTIQKVRYWHQYAPWFRIERTRWVPLCKVFGALLLMLLIFDEIYTAVDGKVQVFRKDGKAFAYRWGNSFHFFSWCFLLDCVLYILTRRYDASLGDWIELGEVVSNPSKKTVLHGKRNNMIPAPEVRFPNSSAWCLKESSMITFAMLRWKVPLGFRFSS